jgi:hypothetical protein
MATVTEECITEEQRWDVCFLWAKGLNAKDMHEETFTVYVEKCLLHKAVPPLWKTFS